MEQIKKTDPIAVTMDCVEYAAYKLAELHSNERKLHHHKNTINNRWIGVGYFFAAGGGLAALILLWCWINVVMRERTDKRYQHELELAKARKPATTEV